MDGDRVSDRIGEFLPTLGANLFPLAGIVALDWRALDVLFVYWVEIAALVVVYSLVSLVAAREPRLEDRTVDPPRWSLPFVPSDERSYRLTSWLPPIYPRNHGYAVGMVVWGLWIWFLAGYPLVVLANGGGTDRLGVYVATLQSITTPAGLLSALPLVVSQAATASREFLVAERYRAVSAPMVVETPGRRLAFWFPYLLIGTFGSLLLAAGLSSLPGLVMSAEVGMAVLFVAGKLLVEWGSFRADCGVADSRLSRWFGVQAYDP